MIPRVHQKHIVVIADREGQVGRVLIIRLEKHIFGFRLWLHHAQHMSKTHTQPFHLWTLDIPTPDKRVGSGNVQSPELNLGDSRMVVLGHEFEMRLRGD